MTLVNIWCCECRMVFQTVPLDSKCRFCVSIEVDSGLKPSFYVLILRLKTREIYLKGVSGANLLKRILFWKSDAKLSLKCRKWTISIHDLFLWSLEWISSVRSKIFQHSKTQGIVDIWSRPNPFLWMSALAVNTEKEVILHRKCDRATVNARIRVMDPRECEALAANANAIYCPDQCWPSRVRWVNHVRKVIFME